MNLHVLAGVILAAQVGCASAWRDRYDRDDRSHRLTAELCRAGAPSPADFDRCMEELLPPSAE